MVICKIDDQCKFCAWSRTLKAGSLSHSHLFNNYINIALCRWTTFISPTLYCITRCIMAHCSTAGCRVEGYVSFGFSVITKLPSTIYKLITLPSVVSEDACMFIPSSASNNLSITFVKKINSRQFIKQAVLLNAYYSVKENNLKRLYCMILTFWKRQNYGDRKKISGFQGLGNTEGWQGRE